MEGLDQYQAETLTFDNCRHIGLAYYGLGIAGEAGETADKVKKILREIGDGDIPLERREAIMLEIGDVMWYAATLADYLGYKLSDVAQANIDKLASRVDRGVLYGSGDSR